MKTAGMGITGGLIKIPELTKPQAKALQQLESQEGYKIICKSIEATVKENNARLVNWTFNAGEQPEVTEKKATQYRELRKQNDLLKSFLMFARNTKALAESKSTDAFVSTDAYE